MGSHLFGQDKHGVEGVTAWNGYEFSVAVGLVTPQTPGRRKSINDWVK